MIAGTLDSNTDVEIPVIGISDEDGRRLLGEVLGEMAMVKTKEGYSYLDGTS